MLSHHLQEITKALVPVSQTPALDAELLLAHVLDKDRNYVLTHPSHKLTTEQLHKLEKLSRKRLKSYPLSYLTNQREFWGNNFYVDESVLIPRPETELLVEEAVRTLAGANPQHVADIGTGSGCIAISLVKEAPDHTYLATDISPAALRIASLNAIKHRAADKITFYEGNLLEPLFHPAEPLPNRNLLLIANLPYIDIHQQQRDDLTPKPRALSEGTRFEPRRALHGGYKGMELPKQFLSQVQGYGLQDSIILMEIGYDQIDELYDYTKRLLPHANIGARKDLGGLERMIRIEV
ncbi:peptide chain release factor N(5)-glutamine methyltransferase [Patescibacteria group bacterium]